MIFRPLLFAISVFIGVSAVISCSGRSENNAKEGSAENAKLTSGKAEINVNIADIKKKPEKHAERVSQALYNESVDRLAYTDRYTKIRQEDGYEGWIRSYYLSDIKEIPNAPTYFVNSFLAPAYINPDRNSERKTMFPFGCILKGNEENGFLKIESERYGIVYLDLADLIKDNSRPNIIRPDSALICREAEKFIGAPYLWGGKSFYGIDCSGLTQMVMRRFGINLLRDSKDQIAEGKEVTRDSIRAGDLLFFPHHVGLAVTKNFKSASGQTTVPISRPSIIAPFLSPGGCFAKLR